MTPRDTIAAIATAPGRGGIGVVRISGRDLSRFGSDAKLLRTSDFSNFRSGWWCVAVPASSQGDAQQKVNANRRKAPGGYAKKGC